MPKLIEDGAPVGWQELQQSVARILSEAEFDVQIEAPVETVRGRVSVDVVAIDNAATPPTTMFCECKHWGNNVPQTVVHSFRTVVQDAGATTGLLIATSGFQRGAYHAAAMSSVRVQTWLEFQDMFAERWWIKFGAPTLQLEMDPLIEYTEPINSRIFRKADALPEDRREEFKSLRFKHAGLGLGLLPAMFSVPGLTAQALAPTLPMRQGGPTDRILEENFPEAVMRASSLRGFLDAVILAARQALAEFDQVFGERA